MTGSRLIIAVVSGLSLTAAIVHADAFGAKRPVTATVEVHDNFFDPRSATVEKGEAVRWSWEDDHKHNVVFKKGPSGASKKNIKRRGGGSVTRSFSAVGTYRYVCTLYDGMEGMVTVTP